METTEITIALKSDHIHMPLLWLLESGWLTNDMHSLVVKDDLQAIEAIKSGEATVGLIDPFALEKENIDNLRAMMLCTDAQAPDILAVSAKRLDEIDYYQLSPDFYNTLYEHLVDHLMREYYGIQNRYEQDSTTLESVELARILIGKEALEITEEYEYTENLCLAWWIMHGTPLVRSVLYVPEQHLGVQHIINSKLNILSDFLDQQGPTIAREVSNTTGITLDKWEVLINSLTLTTNEQARKGLRQLLSLSKSKR
ncbi:hypothetical protein Tter_1598 [Thermobaculum terrenum ATCC BAA-798]|uniref:Uncharacterized protein n=1 Tax=Thermobaculum terrenum (strain ATCC BAA-798 / CCMEE 7001 / YNP1) TaxID=525904 RepID=D1CCI9_THET1|nr:hypothetical protein [Thermobaculum terrenum]ACZ42504.1 hypothetical protein Tter_1598 [Thermobaculum terrenum ATCC BAA-798]